MYQFIQLVHERDLSLVQSNSVSEGRIRSLHSTNHMLCHISYSNAIGSRFSQSWQDETVHRLELTAPRCSEGRNFSEREIWVNGLRERERFRSPKRFVQKEWVVHDVTSLLASLRLRQVTVCSSPHEREGWGQQSSFAFKATRTRMAWWKQSWFWQCKDGVFYTTIEKF